ncbi:MAG TPA: hypothetical protein VMV10_03345 [Pirellulales bacterium]|nr:hypothetical protein [Pirellulales bacterium]
MDDVNPYAAPQHDLPLNAAAPEPGFGIWRDGELLLMREDALLPDRCVMCNAPAAGRRVRVSLRWLAPIHVFGFSIPLFERGARIEVGVCPRHRRRRRLAMAAVWLLYALGLSMVIVALANFPPRLPFVLPNWLVLDLMAGGLIVMISAPICETLLVSPPVKPHSIQGGYIRLKKVDPDYLAELPPFRIED